MKHRALSGALALVLLVALGATQVSAGPRDDAFTIAGSVSEVSRFDEAKSLTGRLAQTDPSLLGRESSRLVNVVVKLDYDPVAVYGGGIAGLRATSPEVTGRSLSARPAAVRAYQGYANGFESRVRRDVAARLPDAEITQSFQLAYGGLAMRLPVNQVGRLLRVRGVAAVQRDRLEQPLAVQEPYQFIGAEAVWPSLGGSDHAGEGVLVANLDTGIWPENPMLEDRGLPAPPNTYGCEFGLSGDPNDVAFVCNNKVVGAYAFTDTYTSVFDPHPDEYCAETSPGVWVCSARDADGHGTHTLTTAAGDFVQSAPMWGIDRGPTSGMAPGAWTIGYRVCLDEGCFQSDSVAAVDQAIDDEVDVINFSISGGENAYADPVEQAFLSAYAAGILVNASAGNAGPNAGTADHAGAWTNTVGASYPSRIYQADLHLASSDSSTLDVTGVTITPGIDPALPVVLPTSVAGYTSLTCSVDFPAGSLAGKIVLCNRGNPAGRADSGFRALQGDAAGMILANVTHQDLFTDLHWLPTIMLNGGIWQGVVQPADAVRSFVATEPDVTGTFTTGVRTEQTPDIMTTFSSRGPLGDWIKPDVTAPGIEILAGRSPHPASIAIPSGPPGDDFMAIAGTSMSAPHATGVAALVKAAHPGWTPGQIKSALMTSSVQTVLKPDGVSPADPFNTGAGSIRANRAVSPTLTFDVSALEYATLGADAIHRIDANIPSINAPVFGGIISTKRTITNVSGAPQRFEVTSSAPAGASISVSPSRFSMAPDERKLLTITISGEGLAADTQYFGSITLASGGANAVYVPVAFFKQQGVVTLTHTCDPASIPVGTSSDCTVTAQNLSPSPASVRISERAPDRTGVELRDVQVALDRARTSNLRVNGVLAYEWTGTLEASIAPTIDSIAPGVTPGPGYLPLSDFGVPPIAGMGDETIVNFGVPAFQWGHETYTQIGVDSNGYIIVGGGVAGDNSFVPQTLPDPAAPNNVIAPLWTDLDLTPGPGCVNNGTTSFCGARIATLGDGADTWIIVDYQDVPTFGEGPGNVHDFQIWIGINGDANPNEDISLGYGDLGTGAATGLNAGAENRDGSSGQNISPLPVSGDQFVITTSPPTPGGMVVITYDAFGRKAGDYVLTARMTTSLTPGITSAQARLTVT